KQVDFLEAYVDHTICWTYYQILEDERLNIPKWNDKFKISGIFEVNFNNFAFPYCTYTLTTLFRKKCLENIDLKKYHFFKDNTLYSICLYQGKGALLNFFSSVYRVHNLGVYSSASLYNQAFSNYTNTSEILKIIPESRVSN